jgi:hypothetical protein
MFSLSVQISGEARMQHLAIKKQNKNINLNHNETETFIDTNMENIFHDVTIYTYTVFMQC